MATREKLLATATEYTRLHERMDIPGFMKMCTPQCTHRQGPKSIPTPELDNAQYEAMHKQVFSQFTSYSAEIVDAVVDVTSRKVVLFLNAGAETVHGPYRNQYIVTLTLTPDGEQLTDEQIFVDSHTMIEWTKKMPMPEI